MRCGIRMPENSDKRQGPPDPSVTALRQVTGGRTRSCNRVGEGGMASFILRDNVCLDSPVVIKVLHPHLAASRRFASAFRREAESAAQLMHPHICKSRFGMGRSRLLVMPYLARGTLAIDRRPPFALTGDDGRSGLRKWRGTRLRAPEGAPCTATSSGQHPVRRGRECAGDRFRNRDGAFPEPMRGAERHGHAALHVPRAGARQAS